MATNDQKFLSLTGLNKFWTGVKNYIAQENAKIKVSVGTNGELTSYSFDEAGRVLSVDEKALKAKFKSVEDRITLIDGTEGTVAGLDARMTAAEGDIDALQTTVNGDGAGSVKSQIATALNTAKGYTDTREEALRGDATADETLGKLRASIAALSGSGSGSVADQITNALDALDYTDAEATGTGYVSAVTQENGKIAVTKTALPTYEVLVEANDFVTVTPAGTNDKKFTISVSDIASADALSKLTQDVRALDAAETGRVSVLETKVDALSSATHFIGVKNELPATAAAGDVVIVGEKEYIYSEGAWVELGDTTAEKSRLTALETTVNGTAEADGLVKKVADLQTAVNGNSVVNSFGGVVGAVTVRSGSTTEGDVNFTMNGKELQASVVIPASVATAVQDVEGIDGAHTKTTVTENGVNRIVKVDVATVAEYDDQSTAIPTAGSVMSKINAAVNALNANATTDTATTVSKIVTSVSQSNGKLIATEMEFAAISDSEIDGLF